MTLQECYKAAMCGRRIIVDGILYDRIYRAGYLFKPDGTYIEFAEVIESRTGSIRSVNPGAISMPGK